MEFGHKIFHEIDLFDFTNFFGLDFFKCSGPQYEGKTLLLYLQPQVSAADMRKFVGKRKTALTNCGKEKKDVLQHLILQNK